MEKTGTNPFKLLVGMLIFAVILCSGCAKTGELIQSCKVIDPDLEQGVYRGGCKDGLADGYAEVSGLGHYRGEFLAGKKHGKGIKVMPNGDRYVGEFQDDYRHGKGVYIWGKNTPWAGDRYEGEYQHDLRQGWGVFQWGNGDRYEGAWQSNLRLGPSVMESRRAQSDGAAAQSVNIASTVCAEAQQGLTSRQRVMGKVEQVVDGQIQVSIIAVEDDVASYQGREVKAGDVFLDKAINWQLCGRK